MVIRDRQTEKETGGERERERERERRIRKRVSYNNYSEVERECL